MERPDKDLLIEPPKKESRFKKVVHVVFVKDFEIKIIAVVAGFVFWLLFRLLTGLAA
jgi:hypothetical protein